VVCGVWRVDDRIRGVNASTKHSTAAAAALGLTVEPQW